MWSGQYVEATNWYTEAENRVDADADLAQYRDLLLETDWTEGDGHYRWVATENKEDLLEWCDTIRRGEVALNADEM